MVRSAIIGLGNIGFLFDFDGKRDKTWSHASAYRDCPATELVGAVETDPDKARLFAERYPGVPVFGSVDELFVRRAPELVSICTPTATHEGLFMDVLQHPVKAIFCEKPFAHNAQAAYRMRQAAAARGVPAAVNHLRRWYGAYVAAARLIREGRIGALTAVRAVYPGQIFNMGTHLIDTIRMMIPHEVVKVLGMFSPPGGGVPADPHISGNLIFDTGLAATFNATGCRERLVFEIDVLGEKGRVCVVDSGRTLKLYAFAESANYSGYEELASVEAPGTDNDPLLDAITDVAAVALGQKPAASCTSDDGHRAMVLVDALLESASQGSPWITITPTETV